MLRGALAAAAGVAPARVAFEGVRRLPQKASPAGVTVRVIVQTGADVLAAKALLDNLQACAGCGWVRGLGCGGL